MLNFNNAQSLQEYWDIGPMSHDSASFRTVV